MSYAYCFGYFEYLFGYHVLPEPKVYQTLNPSQYFLRLVPDSNPIFWVGSDRVFGYGFLCPCLFKGYRGFLHENCIEFGLPKIFTCDM